MPHANDERDLIEQERRILGQLALRLVDADTSFAIGRAVCEACRRLFDHDAFHISERAPETQLFRRLYAEDTVEGRRVEFPPTDPPNLYRTAEELHAGQALLINRPTAAEATPAPSSRDSAPSADEDAVPSPPPDDPGSLQRFGDEDKPSASLLFAPIMVGGRLFGVLSVQSYTPQQYSETDLMLLKSLGHLVAPALRRLQAEEELRLSRDRFRRAIEQADAVPYEKDFATRQLLYLGEGMQRLTGYTADELIPEVWRAMVQEVVFQGDLAGLSTEEVARGAREGKITAYRADYRIRTKDGLERWISDYSINILGADGKPSSSLGILQDNTERIRTLTLNRVLSQLGRRMSAAVSPGEVAHVVVETADELIGWDACYFDLYLDQREGVQSILNIDTVGGVRCEFPSIYDEAKITTPGPLTEKSLREGPQLLLRPAAESAADAPAAEDSPLPFGETSQPARSILAVPIRERGKRTIGVLSIQSYKPDAYTPQDLELLEILSDHCAGALERTLAEDRLRRMEARAAAFATLAHRLNFATTPREAGFIIAETADALLGWDAYHVGLYWPDLQQTDAILNLDTVDGRRDEFPIVNQTHLPTPSQLRAIRQGAFLVLRNPKTVEEEARQQKAMPFGNVAHPSLSLMYVPARTGDSIVGVLSLQSYTPNAYTEADLQTFQALADHCAGTLGRLRIEKRLWEERHLLRTLIDNLPDFIYVKDKDCRFVVNNQAHCRFLGVEGQEQALGKTDYDFLPRPTADALYCDDFGLIQTGKELPRKEERLTGAAGRSLWVETTKAPLRDDHGTVVGLVGISRDITENKRARQALARQARELARSNAELEDFAYIASHDLQEPLRKILAFGDRLKERASERLDEKTRDYLERMQNAAARMKGLINDLLSFSRVTTQARPFERIDLAAIVHEVVSDLEARIEQTGGRVEIGALPTLEADPVQMRQLFQNLIGNSLKFHKPGEAPVVWVHAATETNQDPAADNVPNPPGGAPPLQRLVIEDNGIGFDEKYLDRIFSPFQRLHGRNEYEGTGIGLALCRKIVERHGGKIAARSIPERGSTFVVELPATQTKETPSDV